MLPSVNFTLGQGGLGRPLQGFDHYSAMIAYYKQASVNTAYAAIGDKIYTSIQDAEADGVVNTYVEATAASSTQTVTAIGTNGDTVTLTFTDWNSSVVSLGTYTKVSGDSTVTLVATGIVAAINALSYIHGFTATVGSSGAYTITAPKSYGIYPNTKSTVNTLSTSATLAITNAAFSSGTKSNLAMWHYQISEFFRGNPLGILFFSIKFDANASSLSVFNAQVITDGTTVANLFTGKARQILIYSSGRATDYTTLNAAKTLRTSLLASYIPSVFLVLGDLSGTALSAQYNMRSLSDDGVAPILGQSGTGVGFQLSQTQQLCIGSAGLALGINSLCAVSQSMAEVQAFNLSDGIECEKAFFLDNTDFTTISDALANQLHDYGYVFLRKFKGGFVGTYFNSGNCAIIPSSDYAYLEDCRTIDKAIRNVYLSIVSLLNAKNSVNSDGTLSTASIATYESKCNGALNQMVRDGDLGDGSVSIVSTTAIVATTGIVPITIKLLKQSIGRTINITIGFVAKI